MVKGSSKLEPNGSGRHTSLLPSERHEDDQLLPPPPLSYLVDRGPGDLNARHASSTPTLVNSPTSPKNGGFSSPGMSPSTAPSSNLPSPSSSGRSGADRDVVIEGRRVGPGGGNYENQEDVAIDGAKGDDGERKSHPGNVYLMTLEPSMRQRVLSSPSLPSHHGGTILPPHSSRPISMTVREKSLPPLPNEFKGEQLQNESSTERPRTVYAYDPRQMPPNPVVANNLLQPQAGFRNTESRRQSFGGITSRPNVNTSASVPPTPMPFGDMAYDDSGRPMYGEFGFPGGTLGQPEIMQMHSPSQSLSGGTKRKSRFGIVSLFGKKQPSNEPVQDVGIVGAPNSPDFRSLQLSDSMSHGPEGGMGLVHPTLQQSTGGPRMSVMSRKALEELVEQDPEFVAYRYPSNDQRLDLLR
jgi:hypothetical protein